VSHASSKKNINFSSLFLSSTEFVIPYFPIIPYIVVLYSTLCAEHFSQFFSDTFFSDIYIYIYIYIYVCTCILLYKRAANNYPLFSRMHFTKTLPSSCVSKLEWLQISPTSAHSCAHPTRAAILILYFLMFGAKIMIGFILYFVLMAQ
jgi:hypothetical protein